MVLAQVTSSYSEHFLTINEEILRRLKPTSKEYTGKRAVLVFFESNEELEVRVVWCVRYGGGAV